VIRVLLADDHRLVRAGLVSLLSTAGDISVVGEAEDGAQAVELARSAEVDVVLMDLSMPNLDGVGATRAILAIRPTAKIVILTSFSDRARVAEALAAGAVGFQLKDCAPEDLLAAIRAAAAGHVPLDPRVARVLLPETAPATPTELLSDRERQVLVLASRGLPNKQIARTLGIAERTVKVHLGNIFRRIGVSDRTSAALWAREHLDETGVEVP
jgi:DNA-binding NarL/FixJ family response regulator